jgi:hypothetical protein
VRRLVFGYLGFWGGARKSLLGLDLGGDWGVSEVRRSSERRAVRRGCQWSEGDEMEFVGFGTILEGTCRRQSGRK